MSTSPALDEAEWVKTPPRGEIVDPLLEQSFDDVTLLASQICETPLAMISLVDDDGQRCKSRVGLNGSETSGVLAISALGLLHPEVFVVDDAGTDPRFAHIPLVAANPRIRFYAGAPLVARDGHVVGMLCVVDEVLRELSAKQKVGLQALSRQVVALLELRRESTKLRETAFQLRRVEEELNWKTAFFEAQINSATDGILVVDAHGKTVLQNERMGDLWKIPKHIAEEKEDENRLRWVTNMTKNPERFVQKVRHLYAHQDQISQDEIEMKNGTVLDRYSAPVRGKEGRYYGRIWTFRDITERKRAEDKMRESEGRFFGAFEYAPVGVALLSPDGGLVKANRALCHLVGYSEGQLLNYTFHKITHPDDIASGVENVRRLLAGEISSYQIEKRYIHSGGHFVTALLNLSLVRDGQGQPHYFIAQIQDISARKQAENALRESNEKFHQLADNITDAFWVRSADMREVQYVSPAFERIWGRPLQTLYTTPQQWLDFILPEDRERARDIFAALAKETRSVDIEYRIARPDGETRWVRVRGFQVRDAADKLIRLAGVVTDITERKQGEAALKKAHRELVDASRRAGMAEVATGVLHNVGNVLNSVNVSATLVADLARHTKSASVAKLAVLFDQHKADLAGFLTNDARGRIIPDYLSTLAESLADENRTIVTELEDLCKNIEHIKDIVAMQQSYARNSGVIEPVSLQETVEDALRINSSSLAHHAVATIRDYQASPTVPTDRHKVIQILVNLVRNAQWACVQSGLDDRQIIVRVTSDENGVKITVADNGIGILAENLTRIFAHGFTTRKDGHGFGLHSGALAAKELGGSLHVSSGGAGQGAVFTLQLPLAAKLP